MRVLDRLVIRPALSDERPALEALQMRASLIWEEYREDLAAHPEDVCLTQNAIEELRVRVAMMDGAVVGFSETVLTSEREWELEGLFVEPDAMRRGVGGRLLDDLFELARRAGVARIRVIAEPHAAAFYERNGFMREGHMQTQFGPAVRMGLVLAR